MKSKINIVGYWGYIPTWIAKKNIDLINEKMEKNNGKILDIESRLDKNEINEIAIKTDKESIKQWNEYNQSIRKERQLKKYNNLLEKTRNASEKIVYKPINQLNAKRMRIEMEISNLETREIQIQEEQATITQKILEADSIEEKDDLRRKLLNSQKQLNSIAKKISKLKTRLNNVVKLINNLQKILDGSGSTEEKYDEQENKEQQNKETSNNKNNSSKNNPKKFKRKNKDSEKVKNETKSKTKTEKDDKEPNLNQDLESNKKKTVLQRIKNVGKTAALGVATVARFIGRNVKNIWRTIREKINAGLAGVNNLMLDATRKNEEKLIKNEERLSKNAQKIDEELSTFAQKRSEMKNKIKCDIDEKLIDTSKTEDGKTNVKQKSR